MEEINLKDFLSHLKKYWLAFIVAVALLCVGTLIYDVAVKKPLYEARTTVVIAQSTDNNNAAATLNDVSASQKLASTYGEIAKSELVLSQVIDKLNLGVDVGMLEKNVTIKPVGDTTVLSIAVRDGDPGQAATIANKIAEVFTKEISEIYKLENVSPLSVAQAPTAAANNTIVRDMIIATVVAILGVAGFALLRFYTDDTVKYSDELESQIKLPVAGKIVKNDEKEEQAQEANSEMQVSPELVTVKYPLSIASENIKNLRTNLEFSSVDKALKTILVTSANAGDGKSFVASNLAASFAQADKRVLLIDCDLRKGRQHKIFNVMNTKGLSNLLTNDLTFIPHYIQATAVKNLSVIPCGTYPPNPSELLSSKKNRNLVDRLCEEYDVVIFDGAPVNGLADSVILSSMVDETLIVTKDAVTTRSDLMMAKEALEKVKAKIAGVVMNAMAHRPAKYYNYHYGHEK